jgi:hypothetical protein
MIVFAVEFHQLRFEVATDTGKNVAQVSKDLPGEYAAAIFGDKDQVDMQ